MSAREPAATPPDLSPAGPRRQQRGIRVPQLLISLLFVALFALLAVWWQANSNARVPALALAADVTAGVPLTAADLAEVYVSTDVPVTFEAPQFADLFIGVSPVTDLEAGTLITGSMFRRVGTLGSGEALVGLVLAGDEAPSSLAPGDWVQVLTDDGEGGALVLAPDAKVELVRSAGDDGGVRLRLRMSVPQAQAVQISANDVVVIEIENGGTPSWDLSGADS